MTVVTEIDGTGRVAVPSVTGLDLPKGTWAPPVERSSVEEGILAALVGVGLDPTNQHFAKTPERFAKYLAAYVNPHTDLDAVIAGGFEDEDVAEQADFKKSFVIQTSIPFLGVCAHHLLPFFGAAAVAYVPDQKVVGLSKLARLVYAVGHIEPTTQERITNRVADALYKNGVIKPKGVAVLTSALHGCMSSRGVEAPNTRTVASAIRGVFYDEPALENKFMTIAMEGMR